MDIRFNDGTGVEVIRAFKTWDFENGDVQFAVETMDEANIASVHTADVSRFELLRDGEALEEFDGFCIQHASKNYDSAGAPVSIVFTKPM